MAGQPTHDDTITGTAGDTDANAYRILIVEDDRSQAIFAQGVLRDAGMQTRLVLTAAEALPAVEEFAPDLVLMDLHMPDASGTELTERIRQDPARATMPIVFLTGDMDPETEFRVLDSGADDFLVKPIRPRHLISAVLSRVKRARLATRNAPQGDDARDPSTGLLRREQVLRDLPSSAGALLLEVQNVGALEERFGLSGVEALLQAVARRVGGLADVSAARLNDKSFLVLSPSGDAAELGTVARKLRDASAEPITHGGQALRLRAAVSWLATATLPAGHDAMEALQHAVRSARSESSSIAGFDAGAAMARTEPGGSGAVTSALREGRLELAFQPIVAVAGGDEAQFQVLLRMRDAEGHLHVAAELIAHAQAAGLLAEVDAQVMSLALARLRADAKLRPARLFVSQSPQAIAADPGGERLIREATEAQVQPGSLVVDLRLDDVLVHELAVLDYCRALAAHGVTFCLGQYQHGPDAEALLRQLPLSYLRLHPRYAGVHDHADLREELQQIVALAHSLDMRVIGARVENPSEAAALWMGGIDYIQGNLVQGAGQKLAFDFQHSVL